MAEPDDTLRAQAAAVGLTKLEGRHWDELRKALDAMARLTGGMPGDLHYSDEPAHVFRAGEEA